MIIGSTGIVPPMERLLGIRDRIAEGGSAVHFLLVLLLFAAGWGALYLYARIRAHVARRAANHPGRMFREVLSSLALSVPQRDILTRMAHELRLPHPTVLVLSPREFRTHANRWMSVARRANTSTRAQVDQLAATLFPESTAGDAPQAGDTGIPEQVAQSASHSAD
jgi:hypothetical protein